MNASLRDSAPLLDVRNLVTQFMMDDVPVQVVRDASFEVREGETLGLVGESGCGKSVTALSIMRLIQTPPGKIVSGEVIFQDRDLLKVSDEEMRMVRGRDIAMVFQEPMTSLNPIISIGRQLAEPMRLHLKMTKKAAEIRAGELLEMVGIADAGDRLKDYPHRMSGGQRQRVMIAMALSCNPKLLIADEPTTALDVTIQAQILELMMSLVQDFGTALMIITHNLGVVARFADRVNVMYSGRIREMGPAEEIFDSPRHPYTIGLLNSIPRFDRGDKTRLLAIEGEIPDPANLPEGCSFKPRCRWAEERCGLEEPPLVSVGSDHMSDCLEAANVSIDKLPVTS
ncbi:MAG: ABC transporter ATP-binding protein [Chloroflexi bacterium]|nr:ABC transporter ATP-binding protein [Chloroflexota bacterium]